MLQADDHTVYRKQSSPDGLAFHLGAKMEPAYISGAAGILGALLGTSIVWIKEVVIAGKKTKKDATYLAVIVGSHLERYANTCLAIAYDDGYDEGQPAGGNGICDIVVKAPAIQPLDLEVEWRSIDAKLMYDILRIPDRQEQIHRLLRSGGYDDPPEHTDYFWERRQKFAELGIAVIEIVTRLRKEAKLPGVDQWNADADLKKSLLEALEKVAEERVEAAKRIAEYHANNPGLANFLQGLNARGIPGAATGD